LYFLYIHIKKVEFLYILSTVSKKTIAIAMTTQPTDQLYTKLMSERAQSKTSVYINGTCLCNSSSSSGTSPSGEKNSHSRPYSYGGELN
jgi:hypothetical protein